MSDEFYNLGLDEDGDPIQSGLMMDGNFGVTFRQGPVLGIVLAVHAADSEENLLLRSLRGSAGVLEKSAYAEADVLVVQSHVEENFILPHCVIAQMKTSRIGPSDEEPADYTEDLPNGCTAQELDALYNAAESGQVVNLQDLSGDWVFVDFMGGMMQMPVIRGWFSNPQNFADTTTSDAKRRFRFRRNNSGFTIENNGDWNWYHRTGQYLQFKDGGITLKHVSGSVLHMDQDGSVNVTNQQGNTIRMDEQGIVSTVGSSTISMGDGGNINILATEGNVTVAAQQVNLVGSRVVASDGSGGGSSVAKASTVSATKIALDGLITILDALQTALPVLVPIIQVILAPIQAESQAMANNPEEYQTAVLRGE